MPRTTKFGVVVFPGSNCDRDVYRVLTDIFHQDTRYIWHKDSSIEDVDVVILPGGFSYGDYLRCGAIARFSPVMREVVRFAESGGMVVGICNGFQILLEAGLLPGATIRNKSLLFVCKYVYLRVENANTRFTCACRSGEVLEVPVAHGEGNYIVDEETLKRLEDRNQVLFRYCDRSGAITEEANPNGSMANIAGIINEQGNVVGLMPHPERCADEMLGHTDGKKFFQSILDSFRD
jgi:phosphoribosylformylglycinamidine synthase I